MQEEFIKYLKIKILGDKENEGILSTETDEIIIEEKVDGSNTRCFIKNENLYFGSHNVQFDETANPKHVKSWERSINFIKHQLLNKDLKKYDRLILFFESMFKHTLDYDWEHIPSCLGFDVYDIRIGKYLEYDEKVRIFNELEIPIVPLIWRGKVSEVPKINEEFIPNSKWASLSNQDQKAEGIVIKNFSKQLFAKFVRERFKEINREAFGGNKRYAKNDNEAFIFSYCTNPRIEKIIFKTIDEGNKLSLELMHIVPKRVLQDIFDECGQEIFWSNWDINFKLIKQMVPKRCLAVLKQMIVNHVLK